MRRVQCRHPRRWHRPTLDVIDPLPARCPPPHGSDCGDSATAPDVFSMHRSPVRSLSFSFDSLPHAKGTRSPTSNGPGSREYFPESMRVNCGKRACENWAETAPPTRECQVQSLVMRVPTLAKL